MRAGLTLVVIASVVLPGCSGRFGSSSSASGNRVSVCGSDTLVVLAQSWAQGYMAQHRDVVLEVSGGGTGTGISALENRTTDIATASRPITKAERDRIGDAVQTVVALDAIAVYVNVSSPIESISIAELSALYRGRLRSLAAIGGPDRPPVLYSRESSSGTYAYFKEHVLDKGDFAAEVQSLPGTAAVVQAVARDRDAIGYGGVARAHGVKVLPIRLTDGTLVAPTREAAMAGRYPLARPLFFYRRAEAPPAVSAFVEWVLTSEGQSRAEAAGFFPQKSVL